MHTPNNSFLEGSSSFTVLIKSLLHLLSPARQCVQHVGLAVIYFSRFIHYYNSLESFALRLLTGITSDENSGCVKSMLSFFWEIFSRCKNFSTFLCLRRAEWNISGYLHCWIVSALNHWCASRKLMLRYLYFTQPDGYFWVTRSCDYCSILLFSYFLAVCWLAVCEWRRFFTILTIRIMFVYLSLS